VRGRQGGGGRQENGPRINMARLIACTFDEEIFNKKTRLEAKELIERSKAGEKAHLHARVSDEMERHRRMHRGNPSIMTKQMIL